MKSLFICAQHPGLNHSQKHEIDLHKLEDEGHVSRSSMPSVTRGSTSTGPSHLGPGAWFGTPAARELRQPPVVPVSCELDAHLPDPLALRHAGLCSPSAEAPHHEWTLPRLPRLRVSLHASSSWSTAAAAKIDLLSAVTTDMLQLHALGNSRAQHSSSPVIHSRVE